MLAILDIALSKVDTHESKMKEKDITRANQRATVEHQCNERRLRKKAQLVTYFLCE